MKDSNRRDFLKTSIVATALMVGTQHLNANTSIMNNDYVTPKMFGAIGDGVTDDTQAIQDTMDSGKLVLLGQPQDIYLITKSINISEYTTIIGGNATIKTRDTLSMFKLNSFVSISNVVFEGTGSKNTTQKTNQNAIFISGGNSFNQVSRTLVTDCIFKNISGAGYYVEKIVDDHQGNICTNNRFTNSYAGIICAERGEYTTISNCNIDNCRRGIEVSGGNTNINGCILSDNFFGFWLRSGANDAHGAINGCLINHNQFGIVTDKINVKEFRISDSSFYDSHIHLIGSTGITFSSCTISSTDILFREANDNMFKDCFIYHNVRIFNDRSLNDSSTSNINSISVPTRNFWYNTTFGNNASQQLKDSASFNSGSIKVQNNVHLTLSSETVKNTIIFNEILRNSLSMHDNFTKNEFYDMNTSTFDFTQIQSPNTTKFVNFNCAITLGAENLTQDDFKNIDVFLQNEDESSNSRYTAIFAKFEYIPTDHKHGNIIYNTYTLNAPINRGKYSVVVINNTGKSLTAYRNQNGKIPSFAEIEGI